MFSVRYMKVYADNEEEFRLLLNGLKLLKEFRFQIEEEETLAINPPAPPPIHHEALSPLTPIAISTATAASTIGSIIIIIFNSNTETAEVYKRRTTTPVATNPKKDPRSLNYGSHYGAWG